MTIRELVAILNKALEKHGNIEVFSAGVDIREEDVEIDTDDTGMVYVNIEA